MELAPTLHGIVGGATIAAPEPEAEPESLGIAWESRFLKRAAWNRNSNAGSRIGSERCVDRKRTVALGIRIFDSVPGISDKSFLYPVGRELCIHMDDERQLLPATTCKTICP
ncbi:hypothetical protein DY000_02041217 [Brassica cretica]|uniref:Uncharacterized protein n=1 Tax=Brassica cretica TaxID=69181 RepID=A0ABQ7BEA3_BRACR|nr:hypothetical protein DY000_02041217 [Brassica cretica]